MSDKRRAVVVGVDDYGARSLYACVNDANRVADVLSLKQYGFDVRTLHDKKATRREILSELYSATATGGEFLLFYFAGHGSIYAGGGHLDLTDGVDHDPGVPLSDIARVAAAASETFQHVLIVLDCCHSGSAGTWDNERPLTAAQVELEITWVNGSRLILAACRPEQQANETAPTTAEGKPEGKFTGAMVKGMLDGAVDFEGNVTVLSLFDYISGSLKMDLQVPVFKGDVAGAVVLGRGFEPRSGPPIQLDHLSAILTKAQRLTDEYQVLQTTQMSEVNLRRRSGLAICCRRLSEMRRWFADTERASPDVKRQPIWQECSSASVNYLSSVSQTQLHDTLPVGLVKRKIGGGGFGQVWQLETDDRRTLAYKVFHGADLLDSIKPQRFRNGFFSMQKLSHPRIVSVYELTEAPLGFTMEYIDGSDLRAAYIDRSDAGHVVELCYEIADIITFAHEAGVIHRDIKPENVILRWDEKERTWVPHLTDFDLAYIETNQTVTMNNVGGVVHYAAPEQYFGLKNAAARAATVDVYAMAQLMYFIVLGSDPRAESPANNEKQFARMVSEMFPEQCATALSNLYNRSSEHNPGLRPQEMSEVRETLLNVSLDYVGLASNLSYSPLELCKLIAYRYAGMNSYEDTKSGIRMPNRAGTLEIELAYRENNTAGTADFLVSVRAQQSFGIPGASSGIQARTRLHKRIDRRLERFPSAVRQQVSAGYFENKVLVREVALTTEGTKTLAGVMNELVLVMEN